MSHRYLAAIASLILALAGNFAVGGDATQDKITGAWKATDTSRFEETWTFKLTDGQWEVKVVYMKDGREVGRAHGTKVREVKDGLNFTRVFDKKPASDLGDDALSTLKLKDDGADLIFRAGGKTSIRRMRREADAKPEPKVEPKTVPAPKSSEAFPEIAQIKVTKSTLSMTVGLSPDGKRAATASSGAGAKTNNVAIWDLATKKVVQRIRPVGLTHQIAWSADGKSVATLQLTVAGQTDMPQLAVWDPDTGEQRGVIEAHLFAAQMAISADGTVVAAATGGLIDKGFLKVWDVAAKKEIFSQEVRSALSTLGLSADGKTVMAAGVPNQGTVLFDVKTGKPRAILKGTPETIVVSADSKLVVGASYENGKSQLHVWDTASPAKPAKPIDVGKGRVDRIALLDNNRRALVAGSSDEVHVIELATGKTEHTFVPAKGLATLTLIATPDSSHVLIMSGDFTAHLFGTPYGPKR